MTIAINKIFEELIALIKGLAHGMIIPLMLMNLGNTTQEAIAIASAYVMLPILAYDYFSSQEGEWLRAQKYFYVSFFGTYIILLTLGGF